jgi:excisionase family DNA binding protein
MTEPLLLSASTVAELLEVDRATVTRWAASGRLPRSMKIGGARRWARAELEEWVAAGCPARAQWERFRSGVG